MKSGEGIPPEIASLSKAGETRARMSTFESLQSWRYWCENLVLNLAEAGDLGWREERERSDIIAINEGKESTFSAYDSSSHNSSREATGLRFWSCANPHPADRQPRCRHRHAPQKLDRQHIS
jgi:hypothetical protein